MRKEHFSLHPEAAVSMMVCSWKTGICREIREHSSCWTLLSRVFLMLLIFLCLCLLSLSVSALLPKINKQKILVLLTFRIFNPVIRSKYSSLVLIVESENPSGLCDADVMLNNVMYLFFQTTPRGQTCSSHDFKSTVSVCVHTFVCAVHVCVHVFWLLTWLWNMHLHSRYSLRLHWLDAFHIKTGNFIP